MLKENWFIPERSLEVPICHVLLPPQVELHEEKFIKPVELLIEVDPRCKEAPGEGLPIPTLPSATITKGEASFASSSTLNEFWAAVFKTCKEALGEVNPIPTFP